MFKAVVKAKLVNVIHAKITGVSLGASLPKYRGPFTVTPTLSDQILNTERTTVFEDIVVLGVPVRRFTNESGGTSVIIGEISNGN